MRGSEERERENFFSFKKKKFICDLTKNPSILMASNGSDQSDRRCFSSMTKMIFCKIQ